MALVPIHNRIAYRDGFAGDGPGIFSYEHFTFNGTVNPLISFGYNQTAQGTQIVAGENGITLNFEGDFNNGVSRDIEVYVQYVSANGLVFRRPWFFAIDRATNAFTSAVILGNPITFRRDTDAVDAMTVAPNNVVVSAVTGQDTVLSVNAAASRTATVRWGLNGTAGYVTMASATNSHVWIVNGNTGITHFSSVIGAPGTGLSVGVSDNSAVGVFAVGASNAGAKVLVLRRKALQSGNFCEMQDADGTTRLTYWDENARMYQNVPNSAPTDGDLSNGHVSPYLNEAGNVLTFRVRYSDGTLKSGTVALT